MRLSLTLLFLLTLLSFNFKAQAQAIEVALDRVNSMNNPKPQFCSSLKTSANENPCNDLAHFSYKPEYYDDGTGTSIPADAYKTKIKEFRTETESLVRNSLETKLLKNKKARKLALKVAGLNENADPAQLVSILSKKMAYNITPDIVGAGVVPPTPKPTVAQLMAWYEFTDHSLVSSEITAIHKAMEEKIKVPGIEQKIKDTIFPNVKELLISKINSVVADPVKRKMMADKIAIVEFKGVRCNEAISAGDSRTSELLTLGGNYHPETKPPSFTFCNGTLLNNTSEFSIADVIAHELTHSIDPCHIAKSSQNNPIYSKPNDLKQSEQDYPIQGLISCLRSEASIQASRDSSPIEQRASENVFCENDQIGEAVSDWMASEVVPEYIEKYHAGLSAEQKQIGYANILRYGASEDYEKHRSASFDRHSSIRDRINKIFAVNPLARKQMNCPETINTAVHCPLGKK